MLWHVPEKNPLNTGADMNHGEDTQIISLFTWQKKNAIQICFKIQDMVGKFNSDQR